jgi:uncharacterized membrane protein YfcA
MLTLTTATWLVRLLTGYLLIGAGFSVPFALRWAGRLDPVAAHGTRGFRLLILPGVVLLWPLLALRLLRGDTSPPIERTAHRRRSA